MLATTVTIQAEGILDVSSALAVTYNKKKPSPTHKDK